MAREITVLPAGDARSGGGSRLDGILAADGARERALRSRDALFALLAALGLPLWLLAAWPGRFSGQLRVLAATAWALGALAVIAAMGRAWWWRRVRSERIAAMGPLPVLRTPHASGACAASPEDED